MGIALALILATVAFLGGCILTLSMEGHSTSWLRGPIGNLLCLLLLLATLTALAMHLFVDGTLRFTFALPLGLLSWVIGGALGSALATRGST